MKDNLTEIAVIVDRSGSMENIWKDTLGGLRSFIDDQKKLDGEANFTLTVFDTEHDLIHDRVDLKKVDHSKYNFGPRGGTALYDAIGTTVNKLGEKLALQKEEERPSKVIVAIFTDGGENSSVEYKKEAVMKMIKEQEETYNWTFLFMAAGKEAFEESVNLGISSGSTVMYAANSVNTTSAYANLSKVVGTSRGMSSADYQVYKSNLNMTKEFDEEADKLKANP